MDDAKRAAFLAARYRFSSPDGELLLNAGIANETLAALLHRRGADCAAVITACNPHGNLQAPSINRRAQARLRIDLAAGGFSFLSGRNEDPAGHWPAEESFLILQINLPASRSFAARYGQLAFLWMEAFTSTPRLVETAASAS